jgi:hypothetical protein
MKLIEWLPTVRDHEFVTLFDTDDRLLVRTKLHGKDKHKLLRRSAVMEKAVIECVENGLEEDDWQGLLYVMGWGTGPTFRPLYVGKAERKGRQASLSGNLKGIRNNTNKFARWGDGLDYHIGDLSHAMFGFTGYRPPQKKYQRWASVLFGTNDPPRLKEHVALYIAPWKDGFIGPSGFAVSLPVVEKQVISLASVQFKDSLLNRDGV